MANAREGTVSKIDSNTNTVVEKITISNKGEPELVEYNPSNTNIYSANFRSNDISIIKTTVADSDSSSIWDIIKDLVQNPLDTTNSMDSYNELIDILTENNVNNDQRACSLIDHLDETEGDSDRAIFGCESSKKIFIFYPPLKNIESHLKYRYRHESPRAQTKCSFI